MWEGGWLHTGDLGYLDAEGYLFIVGRKKEMIVRGGMNVYTDDVEAVLHAHPAVVEAAVVGVPHEVLGEDVAAFVVLAPGPDAHRRRRCLRFAARAPRRLQGARADRPASPSCRGTPAARWSRPAGLARRTPVEAAQGRSDLTHGRAERRVDSED